MHRQIGLEQCAARVAQQLLLQLVELPSDEPLAAIGQQVDRTHCIAKDPRQPPGAKALAQAGRGGLRHAAALVDHRPSLRSQLLEKRLFDLGVFAHWCTFVLRTAVFALGTARRLMASP